MRLFGIKSKKTEIMAPLNGKVVPITETPDDVFAGKVLGDGVAIIPCSSEVVSPVSGVIVNIAHSLHAICVLSDDGAEVLIHLGVDTVNLEGEGFACHVRAGQHVKAGETLMKMDLDFIKSKGLNTISPCIITNPDKVKDVKMQYGNAIAGKTAIMIY
nr:PTS glucose transporter subunit IIA [uncultured Caproiciproducens sp.]